VVAGEEGHHGSGSEKRSERDRHLPRLQAVAGEQDRAGEEREQEPEHDSHRRRPAEQRADQERELDVSHPHAAWVGERCEEEESSRSDRSERPLRRRMGDRSQREHGGRRRQHDQIRDHLPLEVGSRDHHERSARDSGCGCLQRDAEGEHAAGEEQCGGELDREVARGNARAAAAAAAAEERVREDRHVVVPADRRLAAHAGRSGPHDGAPQRHAGGHDAEETADREPGHEDEGQDEVHPLRYRHSGSRA
jgi:hypothetical protein